MMRTGHKVWRGVRFAVMAVVFCLIGGFVVMGLWNWLMPSIFGLRMLTFWQALGLLVLCKVLLGGFHRHGGGGGRRGEWRRQMEERWSTMSAEERERFRAGMREKRGCGWGRGREEATEQQARRRGR